MSNVEIVQIDAQRATLFWTEAIGSTVFTNPSVLEILAEEVYWFAAIKGSETKCIWPICKSVDGMFRPPGGTYWVGPLWSKKSVLIAKHSYLSETLDVYNTFIDFFIRTFGAFSCDLTLDLDDIRAFDWWNWGEDESVRFSFSPRYTTQLDLSSGFSKEGYRRNRKRQIRDFDLTGLNFENTSAEVSELLNLYRLDIEDDPVTNQLLTKSFEKFQKVASLGFGNAISARERKTGSLVGYSLTLESFNVSNHIFNFSTPDWKNLGLHAWLTNRTIEQAFERGCRTFDFNGANSPSRGDDKHAYGSVHKMFFQIQYPSKFSS